MTSGGRLAEGQTPPREGWFAQGRGVSQQSLSPAPVGFALCPFLPLSLLSCLTGEAHRRPCLLNPRRAGEALVAGQAGAGSSCKLGVGGGDAATFRHLQGLGTFLEASSKPSLCSTQPTGGLCQCCPWE